MMYPDSVVKTGSKADDDTEDSSDTVLAISVRTNKNTIQIKPSNTEMCTRHVAHDQDLHPSYM